MSVLCWSPSIRSEGNLLSLSPGDSEEGHDVGSTTVVEFFSCDLSDSFKLAKSTKLKSIIRSLTWTKHDEGIIALGSEDGRVFFPKLEAFFSGVSTQFPLFDFEAPKKHAGWVSSMDWNRFQANLVCSSSQGSADSSVFIWDLNKPETPMAPGNSSSSAQAESIQTVAWNLQVQHILGTASSSRATIWDLRKSEPVIRLTDGLCRLKPELLCWNPDVSTQLVVASTDYHNSPAVIQLWDLKHPSGPVKSLFGHETGISSLSWCYQESNLLLSCGNDGSVLLWEPCNGQLIGQVLGKETAFNVESIAWSPIIPGAFIAARDDGTLALHSVLSGSNSSLGFAKTIIARERKASRRDVLDAFGELDTETSKDQLQDEVTESLESTKTCVTPSRPPRWLTPKCRASFSFGNRLSFCSAVNGKIITQYQVVTDENFANRANEIDSVVSPKGADNVAFFSNNRSASCEDADIQMVWKFIGAATDENQRISKFCSLLGVDVSAISEKVYAATGRILDNVQPSPRASQTTASIATHSSVANESSHEQLNGNKSTESPEPFKLPENDDGSASESLIVEGLLTAKPEVAIEACLNGGHFADALVLAASAGQHLLSRTLTYVMQSAKEPISRLISGICQGDLESVVYSLDIAQWPTCLALILTYAMDRDYCADLAESLADRLEAAGMYGPAAICHLVSRKVSSFAKCVSQRITERSKYQTKTGMKDLIEHAEILLAYVKSVLPKSSHGDIEWDEDSLRTLTQYTKLLVEQGEVNLAFEVVRLTPNNKLALLELRHRLYYCLGLSPHSTGLPIPSSPFAKVEVKLHRIFAHQGNQSSTDSLTTHNSSHTGYNNGIAFQVGGKPVPPHVQGPSSTRSTGFPVSSAAVTHNRLSGSTTPGMPKTYSPGPAHSQYVENVNPDTSNVLAPAAMPVTTKNSFYDPSTHAIPQRPGVPSYAPSQTTGIYQPAPAEARYGAQPAPPPAMAPHKPQASNYGAPPPSSFGTPPAPSPALITHNSQVANYGAPQKFGAHPQASIGAPAAAPQQFGAPPPTSFAASNAPQPFGAPPTSFGAPPAPPSLSAQNSQASSHGGSFQSYGPPPSVSPAAHKQDPHVQQFNPSFVPHSNPVQQSSAQQPYGVNQFRPFVPSQPVPSQPPKMTPSPYPNPLLSNSVGSHSMPGQFTRAPQPVAVPSVPANHPLSNNTRASYPPPSVTPQPFIPAAPMQSSFAHAQPGPSSGMFVPPQQAYNPMQHSHPAAPTMCSVGSAGDLSQGQNSLNQSPFIDRRPQSSWNDPPLMSKSVGNGKVSEELQPIIDGLLDLMNKCMASAPQGTKKKLEDVERKLPVLFDKLRLNQVSPQVTNHLLQVSSAIRNSDFQAALGIIQHMGAVGHFAEAGQFMLPIKVLLNTAQQLHVRM